MALGSLPLSMALAKIDSKLHGVQFGLQSYSFNGLPRNGLLDLVIKCMVDTGLGECDIYAPLIEPDDLWEKVRTASGGGRGAEAQAARAELAKWRMSAPLDYFKGIRARFAKAGIDLWGYSGASGSTDEELNRAMEVGKALGVKLVTLGVGMAAARRLVPIAEKRKMMVGLQGNPNMNSGNPDQIAKPESFAAGAALSKNFRIAFDIGDATGGGYDALQFVKDYHDKIALLYIKDRKRDRTSVPWGEGDTPVKEVLQLVRDKKYPIRCYVDNDYKSALSRSEDVKRSYDYAKKALA
jgi:sugar phosphate isomerase/epimerase